MSEYTDNKLMRLLNEARDRTSVDDPFHSELAEAARWYTIRDCMSRMDMRDIERLLAFASELVQRADERHKSAIRERPSSTRHAWDGVSSSDSYCRKCGLDARDVGAAPCNAPNQFP